MVFSMVKKVIYGFKTLEVVKNRLIVFKSAKITIRIQKTPFINFSIRLFLKLHVHHRDKIFEFESKI